MLLRVLITKDLSFSNAEASGRLKIFDQPQLCTARTGSSSFRISLLRKHGRCSRRRTIGRRSLPKGSGDPGCLSGSRIVFIASESSACRSMNKPNTAASSRRWKSMPAGNRQQRLSNTERPCSLTSKLKQGSWRSIIAKGNKSIRWRGTSIKELNTLVINWTRWPRESVIQWCECSFKG